MIKKTTITIIAFLMITAANYADSNESLFALANEKYSEGLYSEAIESYEQILSSGYSSAALYYNLGNAYYKVNDITKAILNYERALLIAPGDEDIKYNLDIANQLVTDKIDTLPEFFLSKWVRQLRMGFSPDQWGIISLAGFFLTGLSFLLFYFLRKRGMRRLFFIMSIVAIVISGTTLLFGIQQNKQLTERNTAIIVSPTVTGKSSPDEGGTDLFVLHEGVKVWITDQLNNWIEIELADGNKAWVQEKSLERI